MKMIRETKNKVMALGNKLAPKMDGDRTAAFIQAWALVKAGGFEMPLKGVTFGNKTGSAQKACQIQSSAN